MRKAFLFLVLLLSSSSAFAQLDSNTITVTASRTTSLPPDQVVLSVNVVSPLSTSLDDVIAALSGLNLTSANLQNVNAFQTYFTGQSPNAGPPTLDWVFRFAVPFSKLKDAIAQLTALQKSVPQTNSSLSVAFVVQGAQTSSQLLQMQGCSVAGLLSDARNQAQNMATGANLFVGEVLSMLTSTVAQGDCSGYYCYAPPCSLTVKFALTR